MGLLNVLSGVYQLAAVTRVKIASGRVHMCRNNTGGVFCPHVCRCKALGY